MQIYANFSIFTAFYANFSTIMQIYANLCKFNGIL